MTLGRATTLGARITSLMRRRRISRKGAKSQRKKCKGRKRAGETSRRVKGKIVGLGANQRYYIDGRQVAEAEFHEAFPDLPMGETGGHLPGNWPIHSEAMAVHPKRIEEAIESAKAKGVPTEFDRLGRPVFTDRGHRKAYLKAYAVHDNDGGYGD